jgi:mannose-1-phosphate guanylyltransferase
MLNSDVISRYPFAELLDYHLRKGGEGTIMSSQVDDPSRYGVIVSDENDLILGFEEKPKVFVSRAVNAGHYIFEPSVIDRVQLRETSIEREIFPQMVAERRLFVLPLEGYWMDIGTPQAFIDCIPIFLENEEKVLIDDTATIGPECAIGPNAVVGPGVTIGTVCCVQNSVIMAGSTIGCGTLISDSIVGWRSKIGSWVRVIGHSIFGEDVTVPDKLVLNGAVALPHKTIDRSLFQPTTVV